MNFKKILSLNTFVSNVHIKRNLNCNVSSITKIHREIYTKTYPTKVVLPNGASINIRYYEPRQIIRLPLDLSTLSEEERKIRLEKRKPKRKVKITDTVEDNFNAKKYLKYLKK
ncbi:39S ribosomal protein L55, mitochondrial [Melitaea cinxia]|uniref:39S ribosomal protein L55, mitochondrial n=1 Tax=Melitaea cinxia TaxID=113334 RepID=UPI001E274D11|nr:39S ribosomal protein L55, mitochondrial [Melitaea cinxia]